MRHLEDAVKERKNRNIALTGRYGSGKSSVLDQFEREHKSDTLRISINTLGPDDDEDLTNRIQKELVKQLVYRAEPGKLRRSRFVRNRPLTRARAFLDALCITTVGLALLWLIGIRPNGDWFGGATDTLGIFVGGAIFFVLVLVVVWAGRMILGDRIVAQVTTAGTTIALGDKPATYFDEFLDEIVAFFDAVEPKYVIFEDLDRFDDPQIFDSLRELNTLINASSHWIEQDQPLRFIYAIKDSLFERIGTDVDGRTSNQDQELAPPRDNTAGDEVDLAAVAVERANRTKFFELVIPIVPFISHRNARDLLEDSFERLGLAQDLVTRPLLDLVARHTTDMRLLINICNEFAVFAEQLYWTDNRAPGMTPDDLFALVAYKNFHLADFESIPQRASVLDTLEHGHRELVRATIEDLQEKRRELIQTEEMRLAQADRASMLGSRLIVVKDMLAASSTYGYGGIEVSGRAHPFEGVSTPAFWRSVSGAGALTCSPAQPRYENKPITISGAQLESLFPECGDPETWRDSTPEELAGQVQQYDSDIASLRGADFHNLARYDLIPDGVTPFKDTIASTLRSELARDLVRRGFITRNYAEYSARFYGNFIGVDVAFFFNHSVQPNQMYVDYHFETANAVENLLEQVPQDFTSSVSALNLEVVEHLLSNDVEAARQVVAFIVDDYSKDAQTFLNAFMNALAASRESLIELLAAHPWREIFDYIAGHPEMPDDETRLRLLNSALLNSEPADVYDLTKKARSLIANSYTMLSAFSDPQTVERTARIFGFAQESDVTVGDLNALGVPLRERIVAAEMYELTVVNLQLALAINTTPTLDEVRRSEPVWHYCKTHVETYLDAIRISTPGVHIITTEATLKSVIVDQYGEWTDDQLRAVIAASAPEASLTDITDIPTESWASVMARHRVVPTVANLNEYVKVYGVDESVAQFVMDGDSLVDLKDIDAVDDDERVALAILILNANALLASAARVGLAVQLDLPDGVNAVALVPAGDDLFARGLEASLIHDESASFVHFATGGWASVVDAFVVSQNVEQFLTPALVSGFLAELIRSSAVPENIRSTVVENLATFVPNDEIEPLRAAGVYASQKRIKLPIDQINRIARTTQDPSAVLAHLVRDRDLTPDQLIETLALLGAPYSALARGPGVEFALPNGSSNKTLMERLEVTGRVEIFNRGWGAGKGVRNLV